MINDYLQSVLNKVFKNENAKKGGVTISKETNGNIVITISGVLLYQDLIKIQNTAKGMLSSGVKANCLILAKDFNGWAKEGNWGDLRFMYQSDPFLNKIAVVGQGKWKDELLMFLGKGFRKAVVKFFFPEEENDARSWLSGVAA
jgi:hypothetical protein